MQSITNKKTTVSPFKKDCKVIRLDAEYPGYTGETKYAIITDLTEEELSVRYPAEIKRYIPYVLLSREMGKAIREHHRNDEKFAKRTARYESVFIACTEEEEALIRTLSVEDEQTLLDAESDAEEAKQHVIDISRAALATLTPMQRDYLVRHYLYGIPCLEIAHQDGKHHKSVQETIKAARKKFIKICSEGRDAA